MAYFNCPYCPAQAFPTQVQGSFDSHLGNPNKQLVKCRCISKHEFYIEKETDGNTTEVSDCAAGRG